MNKPFQYLYDICLILRVLNSCCALLHVMSRSYERHNVLLWTSYCALMNFILCSYERHVVLLWTPCCALMNVILCSYERHVVLLWTPCCALMNATMCSYEHKRNSMTHTSIDCVTWYHDIVKKTQFMYRLQILKYNYVPNFRVKSGHI